mgnify:FL=1
MVLFEEGKENLEDHRFKFSMLTEKIYIILKDVVISKLMCNRISKKIDLLLTYVSNVFLELNFG